MSSIAVTKCQATGNDFVLVESAAPSQRCAKLARMLCDRRFGIGADGMLVLDAPSTSRADLRMRIFNADGSEAEMCGNGVRCVARYYDERPGWHDKQLRVDTKAGVVTTQTVARDGAFAVRVAMGVPGSIERSERSLSSIGQRVPITTVSMGNPHAVIFMDGNPDAIDLAALAREVSRDYRTDVNVEVAATVGSRIGMRVFERGVGETLACGTGACAVAVAAIVAGRAASPVRVATRGGEVEVEWNGAGSEAFLTGGASIVFRTAIEVGDLAHGDYAAR